MSTGAGIAGRRRSGPIRCRVTAVSRPTPRMVRVELSGPGLVGASATGPDQRVKLAFPDSRRFGDDPAEAGRARRRRRTYTLLDLDPDQGSAVVEFVLHEGGLAGDWADAAQPGDELDLTGPVGAWELDPGASQLVLACDETGVPALLAIAAEPAVGALAARGGVRAYVEVDDAAERRELPEAVDVTWLLRSEHPDILPGELLGALEATLTCDDCDDEAQAWVAGEAQAVLRLRAHLQGALGLQRARISAVAYWTRGHAEGDPATGRPGGRERPRTGGLPADPADPADPVRSGEDERSA